MGFSSKSEQDKVKEKGQKFYMKWLCTWSFKCLTLSVFITAKQYSQGASSTQRQKLCFSMCLSFVVERRTTWAVYCSNEQVVLFYLLMFLLTKTDKFSVLLLSEMNNQAVSQQ